MQTGLRVGDVVCLTRKQVASGRCTVKEHKTGKTRRIYLPVKLRKEIISLSVATSPTSVYAFPGRAGAKTPHRTRQAVWRDLRRACDALRLDSNLTPHSMRKVYAVKTLGDTGSVERVQRLLNHDDPSVTMLYAMADKLSRSSYLVRRRKRNKKGLPRGN